MNHISPSLFASLLTLAVVSVQTALSASKTLPSGAIVQILTEGTGPSPKTNDTIKIHHRGTLTSGAKFGSSYKCDQPILFPLNRVVPCWTEDVQKMQVGGKTKLTCPAASAYGGRDTPGIIPLNSTLNFEVELFGTGG